MRAERLAEEQDFVDGQRRARARTTLLLAAGELAGAALLRALQADLRDDPAA